MTKEEAIRNLEALLIRAYITDVYGDMEDMTPYEDAVNMAIQALQKPKTVYISFDDVMSALDDFMCGEIDEEGTNTFLEMLKDRLERR